MNHLILAITICFCFSSNVAAQNCGATKIEECQADGCGSDTKLNAQKNVTSDPNHATPLQVSLAQIKGLSQPKKWKANKARDELIGFGEGQAVTVTALLIAAKDESGGTGEACNCHLSSKRDTDNHLVLVTADALSSSDFHTREATSITAEITPRVRLQHPKWTKETLDPMIAAAPKQALPVRITGLQLFDTEHFITHHLNRFSNWEVHPILGFEVCRKAAGCNNDSDWEKLDDIVGTVSPVAATPIKAKAKTKHKHKPKHLKLSAAL